MKYSKDGTDYEQIIIVTLRTEQDKVFIIKRDLLKFKADCSNHTEIDFDYWDNNFTEKEKSQIQNDYEEGKFDEDLEWD